MAARQSKVIIDPIYDVIDIGPVLSMVDTKEFQALAGKSQLGFASIIYPSATHTRFAHSIGSYHATRVLCDRWEKDGVITRREGDALAAFALYHDIGHGPFSHKTEDFCPFNHKEMTIRHIEALKKAIEMCDVDYELVLSFARHENPLHLAVSDRNMGMEKLDYLERDGMSTNTSAPSGIKAVRKWVQFIDGTLALDAKMVDFATQIQIFYMDMYKNVYFRKALVIAERAFHKIIYYLIKGGELNSHEIYPLTDFELMAKIIASQNDTVKALYASHRERKLFKEAIVLRASKFMRETRVAGKYIHVCALSKGEMAQLTELPFIQKKNHEGLDRLETAIANVAGLDPMSVLVVPIFNPERFVAQDIMICEEGCKLRSLRKSRPAHFNSLEEIAHSYSALRICTQPEFREHLSSPKIAKKVVELIFNHQ